MPKVGDIKVTESGARMVDGVRKNVDGEILIFQPKTDSGMYEYRNGALVCEWVKANCSTFGCGNMASNVNSDDQPLCGGCYIEDSGYQAEVDAKKTSKMLMKGIFDKL